MNTGSRTMVVSVERNGYCATVKIWASGRAFETVEDFGGDSGTYGATLHQAWFDASLLGHGVSHASLADYTAAMLGTILNERARAKQGN